MQIIYHIYVFMIHKKIPPPSRRTDLPSIIARQRGLLGPGTSTGPCLAASNHEILMILSCDETCSSVDLRIRDVGSPELLAEPCLISLVGSLATSLQTNGWILSTSCLKHPRATHSSGLRPGYLPPVALLLYELSFTNRSRAALRVICQASLRVSADFLALERPLGLV